MPSIKKHVPWEGYGERAALILTDRRPGLKDAISQPEKMRLFVQGKYVSYTPDYEFVFEYGIREVCEVKSEEKLLEPRMIEKLLAAEQMCAYSGRRFVVLKSGEICYGTELRNVELLRPYASWTVSHQEMTHVMTEFLHACDIPLHALANKFVQHDLGREHLYALLYRGVLSFDWKSPISEDTLIQYGGANATDSF